MAQSAQTLFDQVTEYGFTSLANPTFEHQVNSGDSTLVILYGSAATAATQILVNGTSIPVLASALVSNQNAQIGYMVNPPVGRVTITIVTSAASGNAVAVSLLGVNKASSTPTALATSGTSSIATNVQVAQANSLVMDIVSVSAAAKNPDNAEQTLLSNMQIGAKSVASFRVAAPGLNPMSWTPASGFITQAIIVLEPAHAASIWFPNIDNRSVNDVVKVNALDAGVLTTTSLPVSFGNYPASFWENSFLHTVGRILPPPSGGSGVRGLPRMDELQDTFHDLTLNTAKWSPFSAGSAVFVNSPSGMGVNYPATASASTDGDITSSASYDLTNSYIFMHVTSVAAAAATTSTDNYMIAGTTTNGLRFLVEGGSIFAQHFIASAQTNLKSAAYDPGVHAWWRIRESGGKVFWETSRDGLSWIIFFSEVTPIAINSLTVQIAGTSFGTDANAGTFSWEYFNVKPPGLWDDFGFRPANPTYYSSSLYQTVGRLVQANSAVNTTVTQLAATVTASGGTQVVAAVQSVSVAQVAATVTATGGTQVIATVNNVTITQLAATVTAADGGGTTVNSVQIAAITQAAATVTAADGGFNTLTVWALIPSQFYRDFHVNTDTGQFLTPALYTQKAIPVSSSVAQVAASVTATGGTQVITTSNFVAITQAAANVTATGGTQVITAQISTSVTQVAGSVTASGGAQTIATVNNVAISQVAGTVTAGGGTQVVVSGLSINVAQVAGSVTATGGTQSFIAQVNAQIAQNAANVLASGGAQSILAVVPPTFTPISVTVGTLSTTENLSDSPNTPILKGETDNKNLSTAPSSLNINTTSTER